MGIIVRPPIAEDASAMARVHAAAWQHAYAGIMPTAVLENHNEARLLTGWEEALAGASHRADIEHGAPRSTNLVAELDGGVVAISSFGVFRERRDAADPTGELWMLNAHPAAFGTGAATALHAAAVQHLANDGHERAVLWVVKENGRARRFYEREGWTEDGIIKGELFGGTEITEVRYQRMM